jgi:hypothetical protein
MNFWRKAAVVCIKPFRPVGARRGKIPLQVSSQISSKPGVSHASFFPADSKKVLFPLVSGLELTEVHRNVSFGTQKSSANKAALAGWLPGWLEFCRFSLSLGRCVCVSAVNERAEPLRWLLVCFFHARTAAARQLLFPRKGILFCILFQSAALLPFTESNISC